MRRRAAIALSLAALLALPAAASATFPGRNGLIAYPSLDAQSSGSPVPEGIWTMLPNGLKRHALVRSRNFLDEPAWTATGRRLAYSRRKSDSRGFRTGPPSVYVVRANGHGRHRVATNAFSPSWSPHGRRLAYLREFPDHAEVVVLDRRTGIEARAVSARRIATAEWAPDGSVIAYSTYGDSARDGGIWTIAPGASTPRRIATVPEGSALSLSWAPDASALAVGRIRFVDCGTYGCSAAYSVARLPAGGGPLQTLVAEHGEDRIDEPVWSPDGTRIDFCQYAKGPHGKRYDRYTMRIDGSHQRYVSPTGCGGDWQRLPRVHKAR